MRQDPQLKAAQRGVVRRWLKQLVADKLLEQQVVVNQFFALPKGQGLQMADQ